VEQRQLQFFVAVAEELNFTRAARRTHAVQSTVSASIRALERDLGASLFRRTTTSVALTEAGQALLPEARRALDSLDQARAAVAGVRDGVTGSLRIGTLSGLTMIDLPALVHDFRLRHPHVQLTLSVAAAGTDGMLADLHAHTLDLAFVGVPSSTIPGLHVDEIAWFQPRLLVPAGHELAAEPSVSPAALAGQAFVDLPPGFCNRVRTDNDFRLAGITRRIAIEVNELGTIPRYVESGIGLAVVPPLVTEADAQVVPIPLDPPAESWVLGVARSTTVPPSRAAQAFLGLVDTHVVRRDSY
jgi:DNA-binding transcriptional LysR family regulator